MTIYLISALFVILLFSCLIFKNIKPIAITVIVGMFILSLITLSIGIDINSHGPLSFTGDNIYIDSLSLIQLFLIASVGFIAAVYSYTYIRNEVRENVITLRKAKIYYLLFIVFVLSMVFLAVSNNIMGMWIGLEATTLSTAFLIGFNNDKLALEAAWKYIILCSIGIAIGLVGIIFLIYSSSKEENSDNMLLDEYGESYAILRSKLSPSWHLPLFLSVLGLKLVLLPCIPGCLTGIVKPHHPLAP